MNAGCKKESCTIVQNQLDANDQSLHTTTAKVRLTRNTLIAKCSSHVAGDIINVLPILLHYLTCGALACGCVLVSV